MLSEEGNTMAPLINGKLPGRRVLSGKGSIRAVSNNVKQPGKRVLSEEENTMDPSINGKLPGRRVLSEEGIISAVSINVI